jgi:hypothetical protein
MHSLSIVFTGQDQVEVREDRGSAMGVIVDWPGEPAGT